MIGATRIEWITAHHLLLSKLFLVPGASTPPWPRPQVKKGRPVGNMFAIEFPQPQLFEHEFLGDRSYFGAAVPLGKDFDGSTYSAG